MEFVTLGIENEQQTDEFANTNVWLDVDIWCVCAGDEGKNKQHLLAQTFWRDSGAVNFFFCHFN